MSNPCEQQDKIDSIFKVVDRMEKTQDKLVVLLEKVANQDARIEHLEEHSERVYTETNEIFTRLRDVEMNLAMSGPAVRERFDNTIELLSKKLDRLNRFFVLTTSKPALIVYGTVLAMIATGTLLDLVYHFETLKEIYGFLKGI